MPKTRTWHITNFLLTQLRKSYIICVLCVDDNPNLLFILEKFLEKSGKIMVDTESSALDAFWKLQTKSYDAIVSDLQIPDMDGITFLRYLKASGDTAPFIIFTGRGREEVAIEAFDAGVDCYVQKEGELKSQFAELYKKICDAVNRRAVGEGAPY